MCNRTATSKRTRHRGTASLHSPCTFLSFGERSPSGSSGSSPLTDTMRTSASALAPPVADGGFTFHRQVLTSGVQVEEVAEGWDEAFPDSSVVILVQGKVGLRGYLQRYPNVMRRAVFFPRRFSCPEMDMPSTLQGSSLHT